MLAIPALSPVAARVLTLVKDRGVLRGQDLLRNVEASEKELLAAVLLLQQNDLITLTGDCSTSEGLAKSYLTFRPSAASMAEFAIRAAR